MSTAVILFDKKSNIMKHAFISMAALWCFFACQTSRDADSELLEMDLPAAREGISYRTSSQWSGAQVLHWDTDAAGNAMAFNVSSEQLAPYRYLVCELYHEEEYSLRVGFNFFDKDAGNSGVSWQSGERLSGADMHPRLAVRIGALPLLKTNIVFPLSHLDGQEIFLRRFPGQLKGTASGHRIPLDKVVAFSISVDPFTETQFVPNVQIKRVYFSKDPPPALP